MSRVMIVFLMFWGNACAVTIVSADHTSIPEGQTITLTGSGLAETTQASFLWHGQNTIAPSRPISDVSLEVDYTAWQPSREHMLLVETPDGSTLVSGYAEADIGSVVGVGDYPGFERMLCVEAGGFLSGFSDPTAGFTVDVIYVKSGGIVTMGPYLTNNIGSIYIFAEDGAILDFRNVISQGGSSTMIYYSTGTEILGELPAGDFGDPAARQVTSLSLSPGVGPFTEGWALEVLLVGEGTVDRDSPGPYYERSTMVELTATPGEGQFFTGWSGSMVSTEPTISVRVPMAPITATFSSGRILKTYTGLGGEILREPNKAVYADGELVTLTPRALEGFEFLGWGGEASGEGEILELTMTEDTEVVGIFRSLDQDDLPTIISADHSIVPQGATITLTGSHLAEATQASFLWHGQNTIAPSRPISDVTLEVDYTAWQPSREHMLLVETPDGSTLVSGYAEADIGSFAGVGDYAGREKLLIVEAGGILSGFSDPSAGFQVEVVYVEAGGFLKMGPFLGGAYIFAEDGAILDFRNGTSQGGFSTMIYYSTGTEILGELPAGDFGDPAAREVTSLSLSPGVGPFTEGWALEVLLVGEGTVDRDSPGPYYERSTMVELTATPGEGQFFTGWSGSMVSTEPTISVRVPMAPITATFSSGRILKTYTGLGGEILREPNKAVYADGELVTLTPRALEGFEFLGWGGEASGEGEILELTMTEDTEVVGIFRSLDQDDLPTIISADHSIVPQGATITLTGSHLAEATQASFLWHGQNTIAPSRPISDVTLEVDYTAWQPSREHMLLVETPDGSTLVSGYAEADIGSFAGVGDYAGREKLLIVEAGGILSGFSDPSAGFQVEVVYVEAGGVLKMGPFLGGAYIFAEDGAILDFRNGTSQGGFSTMIYYSTGTEILGELPAGDFGDPAARQVTSLSLSPGVGPFTEGYQVTVSVEGPGSVSGLEDAPLYFKRGDTLSLIATPNPGNHFIRWSGAAYSAVGSLDLVVNRSVNLTARFSPLVEFLSTWRQEHFTTEQLADPLTSGLFADPDGDGDHNTTEYVFGGDPLKADGGAQISIEKVDPFGKRIWFSYLRPRFVADVDYSYLGSANLVDWNELTEIGTVDEVSTEEVGENLERVFIEVMFTDEFPPEFSFKVAAEML